MTPRKKPTNADHTTATIGGVCVGVSRVEGFGVVLHIDGVGVPMGDPHAAAKMICAALGRAYGNGFNDGFDEEDGD